MTVQQLSGMNAVLFYSNEFFTGAGLQNPLLGTLLVGAVNLVATLVAIPLIEKAGRKPLLLWGMGSRI